MSVEQTSAGTSGPSPALVPPAAQRAPVGERAADKTPADLRAFLRSLLQFQCALVEGAGGVIFLSTTRARRGGIACAYVVENEATDASPGQLPPEVFTDPSVLKRLERIGADAAESGAREGAAGVIESVSIAATGLYEAAATHRVLASPLIAEGRTEGAAIVLVPASLRSDPREALRRLALTSARFEAFLWRQQCLGEAHQRAMLRETLELLDVAQQGRDAEAMGALLCHELQRRFGCTRVSIGLIRRDRLRLAALSGADEIDRKGPAVEALEAAMEECADQDIEIAYPPMPEAETEPGRRRVTRAHESLVSRFGPAVALSLPLRIEGDLVGVVLLERSVSDPFPPGSVPLLRLAAEFIGPSLWTRRLADRGIFAVARDRTIDLGAGLVGPRHTGLKLLGLLALIVLIALSLPVIPHRVRSNAETRAAELRSIAPPFVGYLESVSAKPGDRVEAGQTLARMGVADLELELKELEARRETTRTDRDDALAKGELAKVRAFTAQIEEAQARIDFILDRLARSTIVAPVTGTVSRGDLEAFVGARVEPGQLLFELVTQECVLDIEVDERDIGRVTTGQTGTLTLRGRPGEPVPVAVTRINPTAHAIRGSNIYRVEASFPSPTDWIKPGMSGHARLEVRSPGGSVERISGLGLILRPIIDEVRLRLWW